MISKTSVTILCLPGENKIKVCQKYYGPECGIIPVGSPVIVTFTGFEWNLDNARLAFGDMISSSNHLIEDNVFIRTDNPVIFTIEIK